MKNLYTYKYSDVEGMACDLIKNLLTMHTIYMYANFTKLLLAIAHQPKTKNIKGV